MNDRQQNLPTAAEAKPCSKCPQLVVWRWTYKGNKRTPLNWPPTKGSVIGRAGFVHVVDVFLPHWATCPKADSFRRST